MEEKLNKDFENGIRHAEEWYDKAMKEYFNFADKLGEVVPENNNKLFSEEELELINNKREELFGKSWK